MANCSFRCAFVFPSLVSIKNEFRTQFKVILKCTTLYEFRKKCTTKTSPKWAFLIAFSVTIFFLGKVYNSLVFSEMSHPCHTKV